MRIEHIIVAVKLAAPITDTLGTEVRYSLVNQSLSLDPALMDCVPLHNCVAASAEVKQAVLNGPATEALNELRAYVASGTKPSLWTVTPHVATSGTWYELNPGDPALLGALLFCGHVAAATPQDILPKGWDGMMAPELNYTPAFGLYLIRPQPRQPNPNGSPAPGP